MYPRAEYLLRLIAEKNSFQAKYINKTKSDVMGHQEYDTLEFLIQFFKKQGVPVEQQAEFYLNFIQEITVEQLYFRRNHCYYADNYDEACRAIYKNDDYM